MPTKTPKSVDEYISSQAEEARPIMKELRRVITATVPKAEEVISWNVPIYACV